MTDHAWKHKFFKKFTWCGVCKEFLWGVTTKQGYKCQQCKLVSHDGCRKNAPKPCSKSKVAPYVGSSSSIPAGVSIGFSAASNANITTQNNSSKEKEVSSSASWESSGSTEHVRRSQSKVIGKKDSKSNAPVGFDEAKLVALYNDYKAKDEDVIDAPGVMGFIKDLELSPEDAKVMGEFSKDEFVGGFKNLKIDSLEKIMARIPVWREELKDVKKLKDVYEFSFDFYKESPDKKTIDNETAIAVLGLLLGSRMHVEQIRNFLKEKKSSFKGINIDQWMSIFEFSIKVDMDFFPYDPDLGEWPLLIDEYVDWARGESKEVKKTTGGRTRNEDSDEDL